MECPICQGKTGVIDSRVHGHYTRRRRECKVCSNRFTTVEVINDKPYETVQLFERLPGRPSTIELLDAYQLLEQVRTLVNTA